MFYQDNKPELIRPEKYTYTCNIIFEMQQLWKYLNDFDSEYLTLLTEQNSLLIK